MGTTTLGLGRGINYAFHALLLMAWEGRGLSAREIAQALGVPVPYMAKLLQHLAHAGLVMGQRGRRGGYTLAYPADCITLWDVALALREGWAHRRADLVLPFCATCPLAPRCPIRHMVQAAQERVEQVFRQISVGAVAQELRKAGGGQHEASI